MRDTNLNFPVNYSDDGNGSTELDDWANLKAKYYHSKNFKLAGTVCGF